MTRFFDCSRKMIKYHGYGWMCYTTLFYGLNQLNENPPSLLVIIAILPLMMLVFYGVLAILIAFSRGRNKRSRIRKGGLLFVLFALVTPVLTYGYVYGLMRLLGVNVQTEGTTFSIGEFLKNNILGFVRYTIYAVIYFLGGRLLAVQRAYYEARQAIMQQEIELLKAKNEKQEHELAALQMQLSPHIQHGIFNKLYGRALRYDAQLPDAILLMADLTAYATKATEPQKGLVPIELELEILAKLAVLTGHNQVVGSVDQLLADAGVEGQLVPRLSLVTLFENAVKFTRSNGGRPGITLTLVATPKRLSFKCVNEIGAATRHEKSLGTGLKNLKRRLNLLYQKYASLHTYTENGFYHARLEIAYA